MSEVEAKLVLMRRILSENGLSAIRLRGIDWFSWATGGSSNAVLLTAETGVAEVLVTQERAYVLTDSIEADRLTQEEVRSPFLVWSAPWIDRSARHEFVREQSNRGRIASDRPVQAEFILPFELLRAKLQLMPEEIARYRQLARESAEVMTACLQEAHPDWTECELAACGAKALWKRGIHPALILVSGDRRLPLFRHPIPSQDKLGERAMLVFCARRHGLYANLSRFVYFRQPTNQEKKLLMHVASIEDEAWKASRPGARYADIYKRIVRGYLRCGYRGEHLKHHQGGPTGYLAREEIISPHSENILDSNTALAWNPSLTGTKIEDTILCSDQDLEIMTVDPEWPTFLYESRLRPDYLVKI